MRRRTAVIAGAVAGVAAAVLWSRRRRAAASPPVRLGLTDGSHHDLAGDDAAAIELTTLAGDVRCAFEPRA